jgi:hypothetical protein
MSGLIGWVPHSDTLNQLIKEYRESKQIPVDFEKRMVQQQCRKFDDLIKLKKVEIFENIMELSDGMDLANILKPAIDRGAIKLIGATTDVEYNTYVIRDRAFLRRFERIDVLEPSEATTVEILFRSLPKIQASTGIKFKYNDYVTKMLLESIVSATSEYKRVYGLGAMYPDIAFSVLTAAFSQALFQNRQFVTVLDVYNAIKGSKRIYPDSIIRELNLFKEKFKDVVAQEGVVLPNVTIEEINSPEGMI